MESLQASVVPYQKLYVYHTKTQMHVVGYCKLRKRFAMLRFSRLDGDRMEASEDPESYSNKEVNSLLKQLHLANTHQGGLQFATRVGGAESGAGQGMARHGGALELRPHRPDQPLSPICSRSLDHHPCRPGSAGHSPHPLDIR